MAGQADDNRPVHQAPEHGTAARSLNWGDGLRRCAGSLADRPDLDASLNEVLRERKSNNRREVSE
jgi:hypothetical protein